eukprot:1158756-Pelagomonas_calceolata.AAC.11
MQMIPPTAVLLQVLFQIACSFFSHDATALAGEKGCAIIYVRKKEDAEKLANCLSRVIPGSRLRIGFYHAGIPAKQRTQVGRLIACAHISDVITLPVEKLLRCGHPSQAAHTDREAQCMCTDSNMICSSVKKLLPCRHPSQAVHTGRDA